MFNVGFIFNFLSALSFFIFRQGQAFEQLHQNAVDDFVPALKLAQAKATKNRLRWSERRFTLPVHGLQAITCITCFKGKGDHLNQAGMTNDAKEHFARGYCAFYYPGPRKSLLTSLCLN
jgi:hypothetical protein